MPKKTETKTVAKTETKVAEAKPKKQSRKAKVDEFSQRLNEYILGFLKNDHDDTAAEWQSEENQNKLLALVQGSAPPPPRARRPRDPNAPKRSMAPYLYFTQEQRPKMKSENDGVSGQELLKMLAQKWNTMTASQKKPYEQKAAQDHKRYAKEKEVYEAKLRDEKGPKRPQSAYFFFANDKREEVRSKNPSLKMTEISKELGRMWKDEYASESSRKPWELKAAADKKRYEQELAEWKEAHPEKAKEMEAKKAKKTTAKSTTAKADSEAENEEEEDEEEEKVAHSGMQVFVQKRVSELTKDKKMPHGKALATAQKEWAEMTIVQRNKYNKPGAGSEDDEEEEEEETEMSEEETA